MGFFSLIIYTLGMIKLLKFAFRVLQTLIPENWHLRIIRKLARVPRLAWEPSFTVRVAETKDELEGAYKLLHDCYVRMGLMSPDPSGLRCNIYSFLPETTTVIVKSGEDVVGSVTLIKDSPIGLPSDKDYLNENNLIRAQGHRIVEVSALAIDPKFRNTNHAISLLLMKFLYNYSSNYFDSSILICTVHPRAGSFYKALWGFQQNGEVVEYKFVGGALAIHLSMELSKTKRSQTIDSYESSDVDKNLALFVLMNDQRFQYPQRVAGQVLDPVMSPELLRYFIVERTHFLHQMDFKDYEALRSMHGYKFDEVSFLKMIPLPEDKIRFDGGKFLNREYRMPVRARGFMTYGNVSHFCEILDFCTFGCFIHVDSDIDYSVDSEVSISMVLASNVFEVSGTIQWRNKKNNNRHPEGYGIKFSESQKNIFNLIRSWGPGLDPKFVQPSISVKYKS